MMQNQGDVVYDTAQILKLLGDPTRLKMMKLLKSHECCVCEFVALFDISQPAISQHMRKFKDINLVNERRGGQWIFYSINPKHPNYGLIESILKQVPNQDEALRDLEEQGLRISCD